MGGNACNLNEPAVDINIFRSLIDFIKTKHVAINEFSSGGSHW